MLVYDVTSKDSFETLEYWIQTIEKVNSVLLSASRCTNK